MVITMVGRTVVQSELHRFPAAADHLGVWERTCAVLCSVLNLEFHPGHLRESEPTDLCRTYCFPRICKDLFFIAGGFFGAFATGIKCLLVSRMLSGIALGISEARHRSSEYRVGWLVAQGCSVFVCAHIVCLCTCD